MSTSAVSSASLNQQLQSFFQTRNSDVQQLGKALSSGNLANAQVAYNNITALGQAGPFANGNSFRVPQREQDFEAIGQALQAGDLAGAQQAFAALKATGKGGGETPPSTAGGLTPPSTVGGPSSTPEIVLNLSNSGSTSPEQITLNIANSGSGGEQVSLSVGNQGFGCPASYIQSGVEQQRTDRDQSVGCFLNRIECRIDNGFHGWAERFSLKLAERPVWRAGRPSPRSPHRHIPFEFQFHENCQLRRRKLSF